MQEKINSFNAAFVDLAAGYVKHIANKVAGNTTYTPEPSGGPLRWGMSLADEIRVANLLAATIGKMQAASGGELSQGGPEDGKPHTAALEFAISVLSELEEIREVCVPAQPNTPGAWELMRDILAGRRSAPEGTVFDVVIDMTGNPQAIRRREELGYTARTLTLTMPGGDTVKLNSAAEAYGLAACIENVAVRVWPDSKPEK